MTTFDESGHDFELRALEVARAIHDPHGLQGAIMHKGRERDGVFITEESIHAYEFTIEPKRAKAQKDAEKLRELLIDLGRRPENSYKNLTGWFVTRNEPTAEQRSAVVEESRKGNITIHAISVSTLQRRLCDSEGYLRCRDDAPFGSISYSRPAEKVDVKVPVSFSGRDSGQLATTEISKKLIDGYRALVIGEFGVGKSHALREIYYELRRLHFRKKKLTPFPVHINLRDCAGLKTPAEILRRHSEEIGFGSDRSLISAWRSGACILLLDGFDEIVPTRWLGSAADLKEVRRAALSPVRRLVEETPSGTGIVACGRSHYFSSHSEMAESLGFESPENLVNIRDFTEGQVEEYLASAGVSWKVPEWLPTRPLLIGYLVAMQAFSEVNAAAETTQATAWRRFFDAICEREARMFSAVRPEVIKAIVSRVATLARSQGDETGPVGMDLMRTAFININNRQPDEEGLQLLLRLPGLAISAPVGDEESRIFVDHNLADTAYGEDLASYLTNPYDEHPLSSVASWVTTAGDLGIEAAAGALQEQGASARAALAVASRRQNQGQYDSVLADMLRVVSALEPTEDGNRNTFTVEGVIFDTLTLSNNDALARRINYQDCVIQTLDISMTEEGQPFPYFQRCLIGFLDGSSKIPAWLEGNFIDCDIEQFSQQSQTTAGIMQLNLDPRAKVALTILKKIYSQRGSGRKESALSRGLDQASRNLVASVVASLVSEGWVYRNTSGKTALYLPVKGRRPAALNALEKPGEFYLKFR
ncbi:MULTISPECIES: NACHT domain-containing protein [unclassified Streptomyces]|uniref:NACHT domain-containing protein n=1 Tax=unclassified Streptomyces TaxID=2593676 RepID=UPI000B85EAC5|nr:MULTISPECIES: NACHT domain-containing protein [unclassified Streptomyces]MYQ53584.1 NTPase [Streptomyces sp. SID4941]